MNKTLEEQLKDAILARYKSIRAFTTAINVPYSTIDSALKREHGLKNAGVGNMLKIFNALDLDIESIPTGTLQKKECSNSVEMPDPMEGIRQTEALETDDDLNRQFEEVWARLDNQGKAAMAFLLETAARKIRAGISSAQ